MGPFSSRRGHGVRGLAIATVLSLWVAVPSRGDFVGFHFDQYAVAVGGVQYAVIDAYAQFDSFNDTVLNVFNAQIDTPLAGGFHQNDLATLSGQPGHWSVTLSSDLPSAGVTPANDSFVLIGGPIGNANSTSLDPNFSPPNGLEPPPGAGWFNSNPTNLQGRVDPSTLRTWIARFTLANPVGATLLMTFAANLGYNEGLGTPARFAWNDGQGSGPTFEIIIPTPAVAAMLALAGLAGGRSRRSHG